MTWVGPAVILSPLGLLFIGAAIHRGWFIPWAELYSVELTANRYGNYLRWAYGRGRVVRFPAGVDDLTTLLTEIRRRAPGTELP